MARGGFRIGSGRKRGSRDKAPRGTPDRDYSEAAKAAAERKRLLSLGHTAKMKYFHDTMKRVAAGDKLTVTEMKYLDKLKGELEAKPAGDGKTETPLELMLRIMNDPNQPEEFRARMACAAAPFVHARQGEGLGKKEEKNERAKAAGGGKFSSMANRLRVVK